MPTQSRKAKKIIMSLKLLIKISIKMIQRPGDGGERVKKMEFFAYYRKIQDNRNR
jgi:hypothetical protein